MLGWYDFKGIARAVRCYVTLAFKESAAAWCLRGCTYPDGVRRWELFCRFVDVFPWKSCAIPIHATGAAGCMTILHPLTASRLSIVGIPLPKWKFRASRWFLQEKRPICLSLALSEWNRRSKGRFQKRRYHIGRYWSWLWMQDQHSKPPLVNIHTTSREL